MSNVNEIVDFRGSTPTISYFEALNQTSITITNALNYKQILIIGAEGSSWYTKTGELKFSVTGGTLGSVNPPGGPYNKEAISAIVTPTADSMIVYLSTYNPEEGLDYPLLMAWCIS